MFRKLVISTIALATIAGAECNGSDFFKKRSGDFISGLENVCFGMSIDEVMKVINPEQVSKLYNSHLKSGVLPHQLAVDSVLFNNWFNDGGKSNFGDVYSPNSLRELGCEYLKSVNSNDFGIQTIYVVNKHNEDTIMAFSFYTGKSNKFFRRTKDKYEATVPVHGLFDITMRLDPFMGTYFERVLDSIGYGRECGTYKKNCADYLGGQTGRTILLTNDSKAIVIMCPVDRKIFIRHSVNMNSLRDAMVDNIGMKYNAAIKTKTARLDE